ncbi:M48 family metalloprotease [Polymorphobacter fuscus]|uniref:M48 family metalloprotease n=1 Tax=Sandarakinorhabdus fusca TaxID=1439888 RepID=A0A7C9GS37_9SPHN|nr:M48 family metalloprotease [Polymorphobacter fuscus]KAB7646362.1 M48 family metalloprotease [Polymorphobacter fuscus]MQT17591.1 M48 family metalloprotease [Polymorphobacter fuscus]NJC09866.1 STE24 endopeptidase [Polymorphobacter fuscus]
MAFDPELATRAWMATLNGAARAKSDAYFEGGYWLILWGALVAIAVDLVLLRFGWAAALSARVTRFTRRRGVQSWLFAIVYLLVTALMALPWTIYTRFFRERHYGLLNQDFAAWGSEQLLALTLSSLAVALLFTGIHAAIRRSPRGWWIGATAITIAGIAFFVAIAPLYVEPLFNKYVPLPDGPVRSAVLSMARANGVPADNVFLVDASRQTDRISANVAGLGGTTRIALNDNLMKQPADEIRAVMAHELGHYVLNHGPKMIIAFTLIVAVVFLVLSIALPWMLARFGPRWRVTSLDDPAILPIVSILVTIIGVLLTPATNTLIRTQEMEADRFGLNAARAPESFASIAMKLSQYRKIEPGPIEEALFFDHPSGHTRVLTAMRWKAEHLDQPDVR